MKGLLKQFKNNVRFPTKDGGNAGAHTGGANPGSGGKATSTNTAAVLNSNKNLNPSQVNGINHGTASAANGRSGGNGAAGGGGGGGVDPAAAVLYANGDARGGGMGGGAGGPGLDRLAGGAVGGATGGGDAMPPPPPKPGAKGNAGQLPVGVVAPSSR